MSSKTAAWKGLHVSPTNIPERKPTRICSVIDDPFYDENPPDTEEVDHSITLYEDKYVKLTEEFLSFKCYYFPSGREKTIAVKEITKIRRNEEDLTAWGTLDGKIWWNYDFLRGRRSQLDYYFVVDCNEKMAKGFTCKKPFSFWRHFSRLRPDLTAGQTPPRRLSQSSQPTSPRLPESSLFIDYTENESDI